MSPFKDVKMYQVTVKHDTGKVKIRTAATDKETAIKIICNAEGCPEGAIIKVVELIKKPVFTARNTY